MQAICRWINQLKGHGTRVDVALDDRTGHATVSQVIAAADAGQAVMRWRTYDAKRRCSYKGQDDIQGEMVTFGSRQSESYLRVYDKRMEAAGKGKPRRRALGALGVGVQERPGAIVCGPLRAPAARRVA